jgi:hypothetical protein
MTREKQFARPFDTTTAITKNATTAPARNEGKASSSSAARYAIAGLSFALPCANRTEPMTSVDASLSISPSMSLGMSSLTSQSGR